MERTEPALVPEWLRCSGNGAGGGASVHHSDVASSERSPRSRSFRGNSKKDSPRYFERSSSSSSRCSSTSNGSAKHPYSSFSRIHRDKNRDREKEKSLPEDFWEHDTSEPLANILTSKVGTSAFRRSQSLVSRKPSEAVHQRENSRNSSNGVLPGCNLDINKKAVFEKDFPSLGTEENQCVTGIRRVSSPGFCSAIQSLPTGNSGFLGGEKWTSALAEVPSVLANNGMGHPPLLQSACSNSSSGSSSNAGLNMAEALSQPAARARASTVQLPDKSQRLEELAIKHSRQLIPVKPVMPKPLAPSSAGKPKQKMIAARTSEMTVASRGPQPQSNSSHLATNFRAGQMRLDSANSSHGGKFLVLKPVRENGVTSGTKDACSPTGDSPSTPTASMSPSNSVVSALQNKVAVLSLSSKSTVERRSSQPPAQSRSEFFNLMRRKTSACATAVRSDPSAPFSSPTADISGNRFKEGHVESGPLALENGNQMISNGNGHDVPEMMSFSGVAENSFPGNGSIYPDEEEAAFLRLLGWEENGGDDEGLTEEEINAFYQEYVKRRPSLKLCPSSQPMLSIFHNGESGVARSSSSESELEA